MKHLLAALVLLSAGGAPLVGAAAGAAATALVGRALRAGTGLIACHRRSRFGLGRAVPSPDLRHVT